MAKDPKAPASQQGEIDPKVALDYSGALTVARQFVQFWRGAQHIEELVNVLTQRENLITELETRKVIAEENLQIVYDQTVVAQLACDVAKEELSAITVEVEGRKVKLNDAVVQLELEVEQLTAASAQQTQIQAASRQKFEEGHILRVSNMNAETDQLLTLRGDELKNIEAGHVSLLKSLEQQADIASVRSQSFQEEVAAFLARMAADASIT